MAHHRCQSARNVLSIIIDLRPFIIRFLLYSETCIKDFHAKMFCNTDFSHVFFYGQLMNDTNHSNAKMGLTTPFQRESVKKNTQITKKPWPS